MHSKPRPSEVEIHDNFDSKIASGRLLRLFPGADHFTDARPDSQFDHTRPKVRFNEELDTEVETNRNAI